jgi:hemolysin III
MKNTETTGIGEGSPRGGSEHGTRAPRRETRPGDNTRGLSARAEEAVNALTHGAGLIASLAGSAVLLVLAAGSSDAWRIAGTAIFATTLVLLYAASTSYHLAWSSRLKARLKVVDHCAIYLLIAGSYTPFALGIGGGWGWSLFGVVWGLAAAGIVFKLFFTGRFPRLSTAIYLGMGWLALVAVGPMIRHFDASTLWWIAAGGVIYTAGTWFYHNNRIPFAHGIWHLFVVAGSACHVVAVGTQL